MNTEIKIPENRIDLINVVFTQLEITYHNQFHKAFPDSDSLKLAKQLWLKKLSIFENEIIFKSIDKIMSNSEYLPSLSAVLQKCKFLTLDANGVPSLEKCFKEASTFAMRRQNIAGLIQLFIKLGWKQAGFFFKMNLKKQLSMNLKINLNY